MVLNNKDYYVNEKPYDEAIKELFYDITGGCNDIMEVGPDSEERKQAREDLENFLDERIKDESLHRDLTDVLDALFLVIEAEGFADGFKVCSILSTRKSALPGLNKTLSRKMEA